MDELIDLNIAPPGRYVPTAPPGGRRRSPEYAQLVDNIEKGKYDDGEWHAVLITDGYKGGYIKKIVEPLGYDMQSPRADRVPEVDAPDGSYVIFIRKLGVVQVSEEHLSDFDTEAYQAEYAVEDDDPPYDFESAKADEMQPQPITEPQREGPWG